MSTIPPTEGAIAILITAALIVVFWWLSPATIDDFYDDERSDR